MGVMFEFEQIVGRIFKKERAVLDTGPWKTHARLLIEGEVLVFGSIRQRLPVLL
jgi:hypothetical protein